ncbi:MAG: WecB/TagA/CpsF family glycosyltransferase [Muribaculaceae bacterium]|nr:WecB/TagA/CpsF family glycosyltransferase [Muribaculaceae bacterium]
MERFAIGKFKASITDLPKAIDYINKCVIAQKFNYICVSNARSAYQSNQEPDYCEIQNNSLLTVADGRPISWIAHNLGYKEVGQIAGIELFNGLLKESKKFGYSHYFFGSTDSTLKMMSERLAAEYPDAKLIKVFSPPFQPLEQFGVDSLADELNDLKPTFFWVGLGAPKQERLMALLQPKLKHTICIGVGLVFEYYAGNVKRAPKWIRKIGMEWLFRDFQQKRKRIPPFHVIFKWTIKEILYSKLKKSTF